MGFMAALGTGFFNQQNKDQASEQAEQDKLTQLSLGNILKNVDSYNASKAEYNDKLQKAQAFVAQSGGTLQVGDVMNMMNMGFNGQQILMQGMKKMQNPTPVPKAPNAGNASVDQQTQQAMGQPATPIQASAGPSTAAAPSTMQPSVQGTPQQSATAPGQPQMPNLNTHHTIIDSIFGSPTTQDAYDKAQSQASTVSGLSPDEMTQARSGHYSGGNLPTTPGFQVDPSMLVDWSKFDPSHYSAKNLPAALRAMKQGDIGTAVSLADNADDKTKRELSMVYARAGAEADAAAKVASSKKEEDIADLAKTPGPDGNPIGKDKAAQIYMQQKYPKGFSGVAGMGGSSMEEINPQGLTGQDYVDWAVQNKVISPAEAINIPKYASGEVPIPKGGMKGIENQQRINAMVTSYDPSWTSDAAVNRPKIRAFMTTGQGGQIIQSANKLVNHAANYIDSIKDLNNSDDGVMGLVGNTISNATKTNSAEYQRALTNRHILAEEAAKYFKGAHGVATDQEIKAWEENLPLNKGPAATLAAAQSLIHAMHGQLDPLANMFNTQYGQFINGTNLMSPMARAAEAHVTGETADPTKLQARSPFHENDIDLGQYGWQNPATKAPQAGGWKPPATDTQVK